MSHSFKKVRHACLYSFAFGLTFILSASIPGIFSTFFSKGVSSIAPPSLTPTAYADVPPEPDPGNCTSCDDPGSDSCGF